MTGESGNCTVSAARTWVQPINMLHRMAIAIFMPSLSFDTQNFAPQILAYNGLLLTIFLEATGQCFCLPSHMSQTLFNPYDTVWPAAVQGQIILPWPDLPGRFRPIVHAHKLRQSSTQRNPFTPVRTQIAISIPMNQMQLNAWKSMNQRKKQRFRRQCVSHNCNGSSPSLEQIFHKRFGRITGPLASMPVLFRAGDLSRKVGKAWAEVHVERGPADFPRPAWHGYLRSRASAADLRHAENLRHQ